MLQRERSRAKQLRRLVRLERDSPLAWSEPQLLLRGFLSERRWLYPALRQEPRRYVSDVEMKNLVFRLNPLSVRRSLNSKLAFHDALSGCSMDHFAPATLGPSSRDDHDAAARADHDAAGGWILKPDRGSGGRGVTSARTLADAREQASRRNEPMVIQERLPHSDWARGVSPAAIPTVRVLTVRPDPASTPFVAAASLRMGVTKTGCVDNFSAGGLAAQVDLRTGRLSSAAHRPHEPTWTRFSHHPQSGARIEGQEIPSWKAVCRLALALMDAFPAARHVGWDIYPAPDGPKVVEGNAAPNLNIFQAHGSILGTPGVRDFYVAHGLKRRPWAWTISTLGPEGMS